MLFKRFLNKNLYKESYYLNFGSRKEQIIFARLRLKCSSLKDHLFQKNVFDSDLCTRGKIETIAHYLLHCPNYIFIRNETIQTLPTIDVQSLIFGNSLKNENENRLVFETVSKYIARTTTKLIKHKCAKELTRLHINYIYWVVDYDDSM